MTITDSFIKKFNYWRSDWPAFVVDVLKGKPDKDQIAIIESFQHNPMTAVASGTARGKDWTAACCAVCFMYLTPKFDAKGNLVKNTKIAMTAPTGRQVQNIMVPEVRRLFRNAGVLPGRLVGNDIRTEFSEWYCTGFKADDNTPEVWSGFHAVNTAFIVTEASGIGEIVYNAIEGCLQGNSRLLLVFNPNTTVGYAANAMKSPRFSKFRLSSLSAPNILEKREVIPGQVNYEWFADKLTAWCATIQQNDFDEGEGDFAYEGNLYRPNDLFRVKVLGMFPKVSEDVLIPYEWIELANRRWELYNETGSVPHGARRYGVDVAGMGRDSSVKCTRIGNYVEAFHVHQSAGKADHMHVAGQIANDLNRIGAQNDVALIDTIGEGAGVYSRLEELGYTNIVSAKFGMSARGLTDVTEQYTFANTRAYCYWAVRDFLNPKNGFEPCLPPDDMLMEELTATRWKFRSDGSIIIEEKAEIQKNIGRSPDRADALALSWFPVGFSATAAGYDELIDLL